MSNPKLAIVLSLSASGLHVKLSVNVAKESPLFIQTANTVLSYQAPMASTLNMNWSVFVMIVRYLECTFMFFLVVGEKVCLPLVSLKS